MEEQRAKYEIIVDWVQKRLDNKELQSGMKIESENTLVSKFNVSRQTVRHAISVLENKGILERKRGSGTFVKLEEKTAKREKTMRIAIITTYVDEYIFIPIIKEMEKILSKAGYSIQLSFTHNAIEKERLILTNLLQNMEVDGIVAETTKSALPNPNLYLYEKLKKNGIPLLFLNSYYRELAEPHVSLNDKWAGKMATEYLLQCGHKKIAGIFKCDDAQGKLRYAGYMEALLNANVNIKDEHIGWFDTIEFRGPLNDFSRLLKRLKDCTACVCYNDEVASKLVAICKERGIRVPEDISLIGIDDSELASSCEVPLTSIRNPIRELGGIAALGIMKLIDGKPLHEDLEVNPKIVVRESVKKIEDL